VSKFRFDRECFQNGEANADFDGKVRQEERKTDKQTERQTNRQKDRQTDRQTEEE